MSILNEDSLKEAFDIMSEFDKKRVSQKFKDTCVSDKFIPLWEANLKSEYKDDVGDSVSNVLSESVNDEEYAQLSPADRYDD